MEAPLSVFLACLISRELRRIRVEAVHNFSIEKTVEGGLHGGSKKCEKLGLSR